MKTRKLIPVALLALLAPAIRVSAQPESTSIARDTLVLRRAGVPTAARVPGGFGTLGTNAPNASYSVELSQVARLQGLAFYRSAVDITNNTTNGGVVARIQFSYANAACPNSFCRTQVFPITLAGLANFHSDDMVNFLDTQGLLVPGAAASVTGTLLITFDNLPDNVGWEGTATSRLYARLIESDPASGTIGYAFPASLFFESAHETTVATVRDTTPAAVAGGVQGSQRTNIGVRNTDINNSQAKRLGPGHFLRCDSGQPDRAPERRKRSQLQQPRAGPGRPRRKRFRRGGDPPERHRGDRLRGRHESDAERQQPDDRGVRRHHRQRDAGRLLPRNEVRGRRIRLRAVDVAPACARAG